MILLITLHELEQYHNRGGQGYFTNGSGQAVTFYVGYTSGSAGNSNWVMNFSNGSLVIYTGSNSTILGILAAKSLTSGSGLL